MRPPFAPEIVGDRPATPWRLAMRWSDLLFAHWPVDPGRLRSSIPPELEPDLFGGEAWVGVVPFRMEGTRLRGFPPCPGAGTFPELNVRTYVRGGGRAGVWFFSLDAASALAVFGARAWFGLPYFRAKMSCLRRGDDVDYAHRRRGGAVEAGFSARYGPRGPAAPPAAGSLDEFLVARNRLFAVRRGRVVVGEIRHGPWPLRPAFADIGVASVTAAAGIALRGPPARLAFVDRLDVVAWAPRDMGDDSA